VLAQAASTQTNSGWYFVYGLVMLASAFICQGMARAKGLSPGVWWWFGLLLPPVALPVICFIRPRFDSRF
jgi:hypothetical protein